MFVFKRSGLRLGLGTTDLEKHTIDLVEGAQPFVDRPYPLSPAMQKVVDDKVDKILSLGVIEECNTPWSNRTIVVRRPGKARFCLDSRKLTVKDAYPLPCINDILSRIDRTHYVSSVDLKFAYWQFELDNKSKQIVPGRILYQFRVMTFGLCNAAQRLVRRLLLCFVSDHDEIMDSQSYCAI